jgi:hypothetical protein
LFRLGLRQLNSNFEGAKSHSVAHRGPYGVDAAGRDAKWRELADDAVAAPWLWD